MTLWLDPIPAGLRADAVAAIENGDALGFLCAASNDFRLGLVARNWRALRAAGIYERALLEAFTGCRLNNRSWSPDALAVLFSLADRERLRAAGDPLPGDGPFTLYRGVAGRGRARRVRGYSWTESIETARWFARRFPELEDPAVYRVVVSESDVLASVDDRKEREFVVALPRGVRPVCIERGESPR